MIVTHSIKYLPSHHVGVKQYFFNPLDLISSISVDIQGHGALSNGLITLTISDLASGGARVEAAILPQKLVLRSRQADPVSADELQDGGDPIDSPPLEEYVLYFVQHLWIVWRIGHFDLTTG